MRCRTRRSVPLLALAALAACALPQDPQRTRLPPNPARPEAEHGRYGERWLLEATAIPAAWLHRDVDGGGDAVELDDGRGFAVRAASGNRDQSIGLLGQAFTADGFDAQLLGLDVDARIPIDTALPSLYLRAGGGAGGARLDAAADPDLGAALTAQLRIGLELQVIPRLSVSAGLGGIVFGHFGETEVYGTFATVGATLTF